MIRLRLLWTLLVVPALAYAHTRSESHTNWLVEGSSVHVSFSVSDTEARRLTSDGVSPTDSVLIGYLSNKLGATAAGKPCPQSAPPRLVAVSAGYRRVEFDYSCRSANRIVLHSNAFFELVPTHVNLAQVQLERGDFLEQILTAQAHTVDLSQGETGLTEAGFLSFVSMGIMHIFTGVDHMSFLIGLVLISRRLRDLVFVVTGFTIGHSLTLALAVTGVIRPHAEFIDALVALTIALIGVENLAVATGRPRLFAMWTGGLLGCAWLLRLAGFGFLPPPLLLGAGMFAASYLMASGNLPDAGRLRLVVTLVFGLIHGFGFAADLLEERIPAKKLAELLLGFNLGVEIGQLTIVLLLTGAVYLLVRSRIALPRPIVVDCVASALVGIGGYWFVARSFV
jgi:hypothetical protein